MLLLNRNFVLLFLLLGFVCPLVANTETVSINFGFSDTDIGGTAGVAPYTAAHWNNATSGTDGTLSNLVDASGAATGITVSWSADEIWHRSASPVDEDERLMKSFLNDRPPGNDRSQNSTDPSTVTVSNLPGTPYTLVIYSDGDEATIDRSTVFVVNDGFGEITKIANDLVQYPQDGYVPDSGLNYRTTSDASDYGNYLVIEGLEGTSLSIAFHGEDDVSWRGHLNGLQIVFDGTVKTPQNLLAQQVTGNAVNLSWDASNSDLGIEGYKIYRDSVVVADTAELSYRDGCLSSGVTYTYQVAAYDAVGESGFSMPISVTTAGFGDLTGDGLVSVDDLYILLEYWLEQGDCLPADMDFNGIVALPDFAAMAAHWSMPDTIAPSVPQNVLITEVTSSSIALSWDASTDNVGVEGYDVYRDGTWIYSGTETEFTDSGLLSETVYSYAIAAYDAAGNVSALSETVEAMTPLSESNYGTISVNFGLSTDQVSGMIGALPYTAHNWNDANGATSGTLHELIDGFNQVTGVDISWSTDQIWRRDPLPEDGHEAMMRSFLNSTEDSSSPSTISIDGLHGAPYTLVIYSDGDQAADDRVTVFHVDDGHDVLTKYVNDLVQFPVHGYVEDSGKNYVQTGDVADYGNYIVFENLSGESLEIQFHRQDGVSTRGHLNGLQIVYTTEEDTEPPSIPHNVRTTHITSSRISLAWDASTDNFFVKGYEVYRDGVYVDSTSQTYFNDIGLEADTVYTYTVLAYDAAGNKSAHSIPLTAVTLEFAGDDENRIQVYPGNQYYWQYMGQPIILRGGSWQDNLFNHPTNLEAHLDLLVSVGANYLRNVMSSRNDGNVYAYAQNTQGKYDLTQWNPEYWQRFENFLELCYQRDIIVQVEIWATWDLYANHQDGGWSKHPFNPNNNINYTASQSGLPTSIGYNPQTSETGHTFFKTVPALQNNTLILSYQQHFVDKILSYSLQYPNVLYCMNNETGENLAWGDYWAAYVRDVAGSQGLLVDTADMRRIQDITHSDHQHLYNNPELYSFVDISQNNTQNNQTHWQRIIDVRDILSSLPRPINNNKIYNCGVDRNRSAYRFWRIFFAGGASARFHRPHPVNDPSQHDTAESSFGVGLSPFARTQLNALDMMLGKFTGIFNSVPDLSLLSNRSADEAYCLAYPGQQYAIYFPSGGSVNLDLSAGQDPYELHWLSIDAASWQTVQVVNGGGSVTLNTPGTGQWVAVLIRQ